MAMVPPAGSFSARLLVLTVMVAIVGSNSLLLSPILGDVASALGTTPAAVARVVSFNGGGTAASAFILGPWIDRIGARRALISGTLTLIFGALASATATRWSVLAGSQVLAGMGSGLILPSCYALATSVAPRGLEARALGRVLTGWSVSLVGGVPASAFLADVSSWRMPYLVIAILCAIAGLGALRLPAGARVASPAVANPFAPLAVPGVPALLLICLAFMASFYGVYAFIGDHVRVLHGWSATQAAALVLAYGIGFGAASLGDGLVDRFGANRLFPLVLFGDVVLYAAMPAVLTNPILVMAAAGLWGFVNHNALNMLVLLLAQARPDARGAVLALNSAVTYVGATLGVAAAAGLQAKFGFSGVSEGAAVALLAAACVAWVRRRPAPIAGVSMIDAASNGFPVP